ncbi:MAG: NUDIX domain-containing protein [Candidatus Cloacimonetes bacterium]|nr:NUDIX domain-containing protein [Candidatus Cloacimonadota bacterium]
MPRIRVSGLLLRDQEVLLVEHKKNDDIYYLLPGGGAEKEENLEVSLQREFQEELGMNVEIGGLVKIAQTISPDKKRNIVHLIFRVTSKDEPKNTNIDERVNGFKWLNTKKSTDCLFYPDILSDILELARDSQYNGIDVKYPKWKN